MSATGKRVIIPNDLQGQNPVSTRFEGVNLELRFWKKENPALCGRSVTLADEAGTPGAGGRLRPWPLAGLIVTLR
jgi:hypothetical protein